MARPHKKLVIWKESISFIKRAYFLLNSFPDIEKFGLTSQIKRSAVSVAANIAEGAARSTPKEFHHYLVISQGSVSELDALFEVSFELNFITEKDYQDIINHLEKIDALLNGLMKSIRAKF